MDPLSLTASIIAVATLAENVVTKLYNYCKAIRDCEEEVRKLMVEVNVLSGVLERLARLVEDEEENGSKHSEDEMMEGIESLDAGGKCDPKVSSTPGYIPACQSTLKEIEIILVSFERKGARMPVNQQNGKSSKRSLFSRLSKHDLKWPLSKAKTMEITRALERHKSTCVLALAAEELSGIREVLESTKASNQIISDIQATTGKILELYQSKETNEILKWFAPVNPAFKHQGCRREYQEGTGYWIFDTEEYKTWWHGSNMGLWIYGIPGAGKTILASLVIDKLSTSVGAGFAYFYCRHNDPASQEPLAILGSLVAQLCHQDSGALEDATTFYASYNILGTLKTKPTESDLGFLLKKISNRFKGVFVVLDGLDEVGSAITTTIHRHELIKTLSTLHNPPSTIRTIIFSRAESDIKNLFGEGKFSPLSIAARSSDLQLYVAAKLNTLSIKDRKLKSEVLEALVDGADGMFFWTVCQIELLKTLPTAATIRKALFCLPPGLPATYIRIFERIDSHYSVETQSYIRRALSILLDPSKDKKITLSGLVQAISLEETTESLIQDDIPDEEAVLGWFGCLLRKTVQGNIELAHFSIKEFLRSSKRDIPHPAVHKYLVPNEAAGAAKVLEICYMYLSLSDFDRVPFASVYSDDRNAFMERFPFYEFAANYAAGFNGSWVLETEPPPSSRLFQHPTAPHCLYLWAHFLQTEDSERGSGDEPKIQESHLNPLTSLHAACELGLAPVVSRLLLEGASPNFQVARLPSPLHLAISSSPYDLLDYFSDRVLFMAEDGDDESITQVVTSLLAAQVYINMTGKYVIRDGVEFHTAYVSALYVALFCQRFNVSRLLLQHGALIVCSELDLRLLMTQFTEESKSGSQYWEPPWDTLLREILKSDYDEIFRMVLESGLAPETTDLQSSSSNANDNLLKSIAANNEDAVKYFLTIGASPDFHNAQGKSALSVAYELQLPRMFSILRQDEKASLHSLKNDGTTLLLQLLVEQDFFSLNEWLGDLSEIDLTDHELAESFKYGRLNSSLILEYVLNKAASEGRMDVLQSAATTVQQLPNLEINNPSYLDILSQYHLLSQAEVRSLFFSMWTQERMNLLELFMTQYRNFDPMQCLNVQGEDQSQSLTLNFKGLWGTVIDPCCLCWAVSEASPQILRLLLGRVDSLYSRQFVYEKLGSHIGRALQRRHIEIAQILLQWGEKLDVPLASGEYPLHLACYDIVDYRNHNCDPIAMIKMLEQAGADLHVQAIRGNNAIHFAVANKANACLKHLVARGVDPHAANAIGERPLHVACSVGFEEGVDYLLEQPSSVGFLNHPSDIMGTPLYTASFNGHSQIVAKLLKAGAAVDLCPLPGNAMGPALYAACTRADVGIVKILLAHGASQIIQGPRYSNAMDVARAFGQTEILGVLEQARVKVEDNMATQATKSKEEIRTVSTCHFELDKMDLG